MDKSIEKPALSPEQVKAVLDAVDDGILVINHDFAITSFNQSAEQLTGVSREQALGRHCSEVLRTDVCGDDCPMHQVMRADGGARTATAIMHPRHGEPAEVEMRVAVLRDEHGGISGGVKVFRRHTDADGRGRSAPVPGLSILEASERRAIEDTLRRCQWNQAAASQALGISRTTLWRKMKRLSIRPPRPTQR